MILLLAKEGITTITYDLMSRLLVQQAVAALKGLNQLLYADETSFHFEIVDARIVKEIPNYGWQEKSEHI